MDLWKVTIEAWPFFSTEGREEAQKLAGERCGSYAVRAVDAADALRAAEYIATGIRANPAVWRALITHASLPSRVKPLNGGRIHAIYGARKCASPRQLSCPISMPVTEGQTLCRPD